MLINNILILPWNILYPTSSWSLKASPELQVMDSPLIHVILLMAKFQFYMCHVFIFFQMLRVHHQSQMVTLNPRPSHWILSSQQTQPCCQAMELYPWIRCMVKKATLVTLEHLGKCISCDHLRPLLTVRDRICECDIANKWGIICLLWSYSHWTAYYIEGNTCQRKRNSSLWTGPCTILLMYGVRSHRIPGTVTLLGILWHSVKFIAYWF